MFSGQPNTEKGNRPEENQVSSTSSSCSQAAFDFRGLMRRYRDTVAPVDGLEISNSGHEAVLQMWKGCAGAENELR